VAFAILAPFLLVLGVAGVSSAQTAAPVHANAVQDPPPSGNSGTTIDPLHSNCGNDAPTCGQVGESYGYYNGTNVDLLYSENYFCDSGVASLATTGCEVGLGPTTHPAADTSVDGTSLGSTTHADTLYIPVPLFSPAPPTQCTATATCIDHPPTIDLSAIHADLPGDPSAASVENVPIPAHDHVVGTRNGGLPEWWNVQVIATTSPTVFATLTSVSAINAAVTATTALSVPTNAFLFFQVMPGTVPAAQAANLTATAPPGAALPAAPAAPPASQVESGQTIDDLNNDCGATAPNCENVGISHDWIDGQDVDALYTEPFFCDTTVTSGASSGCEAGVPANAVPPGVSDTTAPTLTVTNSQIDPLYIPVPLYSTPPVTYNQCSSAIVCIDHPPTIDLSRLASVLGAPAASLMNVPLPGHDHLLTTRNGDQPEWWNVIVIPVTSPVGLASVETAKSYASVKALEDVAGSGIGTGPGGVGEVATNAYLWFQTLPGAGPTTPGPVQTTCTSTLPSGSVVGSAAVDDGTGYYEVDSAGVVAAFGAATCYGDLTGVHLDKPIVGMAVDRATGGYWLVASDGGVFSFNATFYGSAAAYPLVKPVVGITATLNGTGYWLVASDGGVFSYNAPFQGSTGGVDLTKPVVGMGLDRATGGYWLVASDGGVFSFNAPFEGSTGGVALVQPVIGIAPVSDGSGYRLVAADGGVFDFNTPFYGSTGGVHLDKPVIAAMDDNSYDGYWLVASDGGVFTFSPTGENMPFFGSAF
jgi:hypothetical protein